MTTLNDSSEIHPFRYWRVAWQNALAAGLCLGLPTVLMFGIVIWVHAAPSASKDQVLNLLQNTWYPFANEHQPSTPVHDFLMVLQTYVTPETIILALGVLGWALLLSRISGYHSWWQIVAAGMAGVFIGRLPIDRLDGWIQQQPPPY